MEKIIVHSLYCLLIAINIISILYNLNVIKLTNKDGIIIVLVNYSIHITCCFTSEALALPIYTCFMFIYLFYKTKKFFISFVNVMIINIIFAVSDLAAGLIIIVIFNKPYEILIENVLIVIILYLLILTFSFILSKVISIFFRKIKVEKFFLIHDFKMNKIFVIYLVITVIIIYVNSMIIKYTLNKLGTKIVILNLSLFIAYFFANVILIFLNNKNIKEKLMYESRLKEFEQLKEYTDMVENISKDLRKFRHDYINILATINGYIEEEDIGELEKYFNKEILPQSNKINSENRQLFYLQNIKIVGLKGLISSKIINCQALGLEVYIEIDEDIDRINIDIIDLCRVIGILFDNAIEEAMQCDNKKIEFVMMKNDDNIIFIIANCLCNKNINLDEINNEWFSTKGNGRGLGLNIIRDIIEEKYSNILLNTEIIDNTFNQELIIYNKKRK